MKTIPNSLIPAGAILAAILSWTPPALAAVSAALPTVALDHCSWNHPGVNPFMGDVVAAVDRYQDIPADVRARLKARMAKREYDDLVSIRRDAIVGRGGYDYGDSISQMHFGTNQVCRTVTRAAWTPKMEERGLVYCESGQCILVPTVCRNVSRIARKGVGNEVAEGLPSFMPPGAGYPDDPVPVVKAAPPLDAFAAPGAGLPPQLGGPIGNDSFSGIAMPLAVGGGAPMLFAAAPAGTSGGGGGSGRSTAPVASTNSTDTVPAVPVASAFPPVALPTAPVGAESPATAASSTPAPAASAPATTAPATPTVDSTPSTTPGTPIQTATPTVEPAPITPVPEPGTWAMLGGGLGLLVFLQRRRGPRG